MTRAHQQAFAHRVSTLMLDPNVLNMLADIEPLKDSVSLERLTSDYRMQAIWEKLAGSDELIDGYLETVLHALSYCAHADEWAVDADKRLHEFLRLQTSVKEVVAYCEGLKEKFDALGEDEWDEFDSLLKLTPKMRLLEQFVQFESERSADFDAHFLQSQKRKREVLFACLVMEFPHRGTRGLLTFQDVADTTNAVFNIWNDDKVMSSEAVRKASARHEERRKARVEMAVRSNSYEQALSLLQRKGKRQVRRPNRRLLLHKAL